LIDLARVGTDGALLWDDNSEVEDGVSDLNSRDFLLEDFATLPCTVSHYRSADKSLARKGRKQAAPVQSVKGRVMD